MALRNAQTMAKRAREQAVKERRDRKRAKKAEAAAERVGSQEAPPGDDSDDEHLLAPVALEPTAPQQT